MNYNVSEDKLLKVLVNKLHTHYKVTLDPDKFAVDFYEKESSLLSEQFILPESIFNKLKGIMLKIPGDPVTFQEMNKDYV